MCEPKIKSLTLQSRKVKDAKDVAVENGIFFVVDFSEATTTPPVNTTMQIKELFNFAIDPGNITGSWINQRSLNITICQEFGRFFKAWSSHGR